MRRAAAAIAEARRSGLASAANAGSATTIRNEFPKPLAQRERQRETGEPAARDHHIGTRNYRPVSHRPHEKWNTRQGSQFM